MLRLWRCHIRLELLPKKAKSFYDICACTWSFSLTLCDPMDCSPPGSSVHGISQARILEWVAISFSRESFQLSHYQAIKAD